jgi:hypothetical protein
MLCDRDNAFLFAQVTYFGYMGTLHGYQGLHSQQFLDIFRCFYLRPDPCKPLTHENPLPVRYDPSDLIPCGL